MVCGTWRISSKIKEKLLHLEPHTNKKEAQPLRCLTGFRGNTFLIGGYYSVLLLSEQKNLLVSNGAQNKRRPQHIQAAVKAVLSFGPYDPSHPKVLKVSV